jgi:hypothetical protein
MHLPDLPCCFCILPAVSNLPTEEGNPLRQSRRFHRFFPGNPFPIFGWLEPFLWVQHPEFAPIGQQEGILKGFLLVCIHQVRSIDGFGTDLMHRYQEAI